MQNVLLVLPKTAAWRNFNFTSPQWWAAESFELYHGGQDFCWYNFNYTHWQTYCKMFHINACPKILIPLLVICMHEFAHLNFWETFSSLFYTLHSGGTCTSFNSWFKWACSPLESKKLQHITINVQDPPPPICLELRNT